VGWVSLGFVAFCRVFFVVVVGVGCGRDGTPNFLDRCLLRCLIVAWSSDDEGGVDY